MDPEDTLGCENCCVSGLTFPVAGVQVNSASQSRGPEQSRNGLLESLVKTSLEVYLAQKRTPLHGCCMAGVCFARGGFRTRPAPTVWFPATTQALWANCACQNSCVPVLLQHSRCTVYVNGIEEVSRIYPRCLDSVSLMNFTEKRRERKIL